MSHKPLQSCAVLFADAGYPWADATDWVREQKIAANPNASTRERESAVAYTARASMTPRKAKPKSKFVERIPPTPVSERSRAAQIERENLKIMLAALGACSRTIKPLKD